MSKFIQDYILKIGNYHFTEYCIIFPSYFFLRCNGDINNISLTNGLMSRSVTVSGITPHPL